MCRRLPQGEIMDGVPAAKSAKDAEAAPGARELAVVSGTLGSGQRKQESKREPRRRMQGGMLNGGAVRRGSRRVLVRVRTRWMMMLVRSKARARSLCLRAAICGIRRVLRLRLERGG